MHALAQVAHLDLRTPLAAEALRRQINDELPADINVLQIEPVRHTFHARHSAVARSYLYQISRRRTAFAKAFVWWVKDDLDIERMRTAAKYFVGHHDFRAFSDDSPTEKSTEVAVDALTIDEKDHLVLVRIKGSHFIWKMVRRLVGVLVEVGRGGLPPVVTRDLLDGSTSAADVARLTAPAAGLFLEKVDYPPATASSDTGRSGPRVSADRSRPRRRSAS